MNNPRLESECKYRENDNFRNIEGNIKDLEEVKCVIQEFQKNYPRKFFIDYDGPLDIEGDKDKFHYFPCADLPGIYIFFDKEGQLLYVGKASNKNFLSHRLLCYFNITGFQCKSEKFINNNIRYIIVVPVPKNQALEAPAMEEYFIQRLQPKLNVVGKKPNYL